MYSDRKQTSGYLMGMGKVGLPRDYEEIWGGDRYVHDLNCGDGFTVLLCQNLAKTCFQYGLFILCQLEFNKAVKKQI